MENYIIFVKTMLKNKEEYESELRNMIIREFMTGKCWDKTGIYEKL